MEKHLVTCGVIWPLCRKKEAIVEELKKKCLVVINHRVVPQGPRVCVDYRLLSRATQ